MKFLNALLALACILAASTACLADGTDCKDDHQPGVLPLATVGALMGIADFTTWTGVHELSHVAWAAGFGAKITNVVIIPSVNNGHLYFGYMQYEGQLNTTQKLLVDQAPNITDLLVLGGYTALLETNSLPNNKWGQLPLAVLATGALVDFSKNLWLTSPLVEESEGSLEMIGAKTMKQQLPYRLLGTALAVGGAIEVGRGWYKLFTTPDSKETKPKQLTSFGSPTIGAGTVGWVGQW